MAFISNLKPKVGLISFTDMPQEWSFFGDRKNYIIRCHEALKSFLASNNIDVVDISGMLETDLGDVYKRKDILKAVDLFTANHIETLIIGCCNWAEPMLIVELASRVNKPLLLYADESKEWFSSCLLPAVGGSLWENSSNKYIQTHERLYGNKELLLKWIRSSAAVEKIKNSAIVMWGGSYAIKMEYLQDDYTKLKSFLIGEIIQEDQYVIIKRIEAIEKKRIDNFLVYLSNEKAKIELDGKNISEKILRKEIAAYLAVKDRIKELDYDISGISIKCFDEFAYFFGMVPCFIPAFIPFRFDNEEIKSPIPVACEGDIKGLLTQVILFVISGGTPTLFGDITYASNDYFTIMNCGASSVFYSMDPSCFSLNDKLKKNIHKS